MNINKAIEFAQLVNEAYAIAPDNLTNSAGKVLTRAAEPTRS